MIDVLLASLPLEAQNRIRSSDLFGYWCGSQGFSVRDWYERRLLGLVESEMEDADDPAC